MVRQSRLRVQKSRINKRVLLSVLVISIVAAVGWQVNDKYRISEYLSEIIASVKTSPSADSISRGTIYDRNLKQIAVTMARVSVYARIKEIDSISETVRALGAILPVDMEGLAKKLETGSLRVWVAEDINQDQEDAIKERRLPGVYLQHKQARFYPNDTYAAHLIGYAEDNIGLAGVEFYYDRLLAKREIEDKSESSHLNESQDLVLTVDLKIQKILEALVEDIVKKKNCTKAAAYVMEGATGEIVGGAQYPGFNPNNFTRYSPDVLENIFLKQTVIPDKFRLLLRDVADLYSGIEAGKKILPWSLKIFERDLGTQLRLWDWLGLTEQWSTDFSAYNITDSKKETAYRPFPRRGQQSYGLVPEYASPLKILTAMAGIFSGGKKIRPHVVAAVSDSETGKKIHLDENEIEIDGFTEIISKGAIEAEWLLRSQAEPGSSGALFFEDKDLIVATSASGQRFLSSQMMFVIIPADTSDLKMLVVAEGESKFPVLEKHLKTPSFNKRVGQIVDRISVLQQVAKNVADVVEAEERGEDNYQLKTPTEASVPGSADVQGSRKTAIGKMPDLRGLSLRRSFQLLQSHNLIIRFRGTGRVVSQQPPPGTPLHDSTECLLILERAEDMNIEKMIKAAP